MPQRTDDCLFSSTRMDPAERRLDNSTHILGLTLCLPAVAVLIYRTGSLGDRLALIAAMVYGAGVLATFGFSAAYHLISVQRWKDTLRACDHAAIFVMIAGSYTPFALLAIGGVLGWSFLGLVWLLAGLGIAIKLLMPGRGDSISVIFYLALGWIGLPAVGVLIETLPLSTLTLLGVGGLLYTLGTVIHLWESLRFQNALWHVFVLAAAGCHYVAISGVLV